MKKGTMIPVALLIACGLMVMSPRPVSAQIKAHVSKNLETVVVRNKPFGFSLGILFGGKVKSSPDGFNILCRSEGGWAYGNARGETRRNGWVPLSDLDLPGNQKPHLCGSSHVISLKEFMHSTIVQVGNKKVKVYDKNSKTCQTSHGAAFNGEAACDGSQTTVSDDTPYFRNFNFKKGKPRGTPTRLHNTQMAGKPIKVFWRYITARGNYVLLRLDEEDTWGFVPKDNVNSFPKYDNCQVRHKSCCKDGGHGCPTSTNRSDSPTATQLNASVHLPFRNIFFQVPATVAIYRDRGDEFGHWRRNAGQQDVAGDDDDPGAELSLTQDASSDTVIAGSNISYVITVFNNGTSAATPFTVLANLPAETSLVSCTATGGGVCGGQGNNRAVIFDSLAADESATITLTAAVNCSVANGTVMSSTVALSCSTPGDPEGNECLSPDEPPVDEDEDTEGNNEDVRETVFTTVSDPPPSITAPPPVTAFTGADATECAAFLSDAALGTATASDNCPGVTITRSNVPVGNFFPVGQTVITYTAKDQAGNTATATQRVTVVDNTPPVISQASVDKPLLWPPNHKMVDVTVNYKATDNCGLVTSVLRVASNESVNGHGDGNTSPDWEILDAKHVRLRAERSGRGPGRLYTITITSTDSAGNSSSKQLSVRVAQDQRR